jgi:hypothetical protein
MSKRLQRLATLLKGRNEKVIRLIEQATSPKAWAPPNNHRSASWTAKLSTGFLETNLSLMADGSLWKMTGIFRLKLYLALSTLQVNRRSTHLG